MRYIEVEVKETKQIPIEEVISDGIEFFRLMGFIDICDEYDLSAGPKECIDVYNEMVCKTEELAQKYGLYDLKKAQNDPWYHLYTLWPEMETFFKAQIFCRT